MVFDPRVFLVIDFGMRGRPSQTSAVVGDERDEVCIIIGREKLAQASVSAADVEVAISGDRELERFVATRAILEQIENLTARHAEWAQARDVTIEAIGNRTIAAEERR